MKKNRFLLFLGFLVFSLFLAVNFVSAIEVDLGLGDNPKLPEYVAFLFGWVISIAGVLALISFTIGAVQLIISGDSPEVSSSAKDRMKGAVLGLVLTLSSFLILKTINPNLINLTTKPLPEVVIAPPPPQPGVYFYLDAACKGNYYGPTILPMDNIEDPFGGKINCVKIINDPENDINYGVIFHKETGLSNGGDCTVPIINAADDDVSKLFPVTDSALTNAADVFRVNPTPGASGSGITFYSETYGWNVGASGGFYIRTDGTITFPFSSINDLSTMEFKWKQAVTEDYKNVCATFQDCPGSIKIKGSYLVGLYSQSSANNKLYCQTFTKDVPNLNTEAIIASGGSQIETVYIIPTQ